MKSCRRPAPVENSARQRAFALAAILFAASGACATAETPEGWEPPWSSETRSSGLAARLIHVDGRGGSDAGDGRPEAPFATIARALDELAAGDSLLLRRGVIYPHLELAPTHSGNEDAWVTIGAWGDEADGPPIIDPGALPEYREFLDLEVTSWERVPDGHPDEWRSIRPLSPTNLSGYPDTIVWGEMVDTRHRLVAYSSLDDFRADNESRFRAELSDPRPGGVLENDPRYKILWTYMGPGLYWMPAPTTEDPARGYVHVRLSPTHLATPGIEDYRGPLDPNELRLSLTRRSVFALETGARYVTFRDLEIRNGGLTTASIGGDHVRFENVEFRGGRYVVRQRSDGEDIRFVNSTFDGGLADWTTRSDVKDEFKYRIDGAPNQVAQTGTARQTNDILVIMAPGSGFEFDRCTFRRSHDGIQVNGFDVAIHDSLFEDINDEVIQFHGGDRATSGNVRVYRNLIRQALNPFSFALKAHDGGIYIYRNIVDTRVPTRGYRTLPPDAPAPFVSRFGLDFKTNGSVHSFHAYHNTFLTSVSGLQTASAAFRGMGDEYRVFANNIYVALATGDPLLQVPSPGSSAESAGNLYFRPHGGDENLFRIDPNEVTAERSADSLAELQANPVSTAHGTPRATADPSDVPNWTWEQSSVYGDPRFANFTAEVFEHQSADPGAEYPNVDLRLTTTSPARDAGIDLGALGLPDAAEFPHDATPDIGALPFGAAPLVVGAHGEAQLPEPSVPMVAATAGVASVEDADEDGFESVDVAATVNRPECTLRWLLSGAVLAETTSASAGIQAATLEMPLGVQRVEVEAVCPGGRDTDDLWLSVTSPVPRSDNLVTNPGFEATGAQAQGWQFLRGESSFTDATAAHSGNSALRTGAGSQYVLVRQEVKVHPDTDYVLDAWVRGIGLEQPGMLRYRLLGPGGANQGTYRAADIDNAADYAHAAVSFRTRSDTEGVAIEIRLSGTPGEILIDDVRLRSDSIAPNGGFERPHSSGTLTASPAGWTFVRGGRLTRETGLVRGGRHALAIDESPSYRLITSDAIPVVGGTNYRLAFWYATDGLADDAEVRLRFEGDGARQNRIIALPRAATSGFERIVLEVPDTPDLARELTVSLYLPPTAIGESALLIDDVELVN